MILFGQKIYVGWLLIIFGSISGTLSWILTISRFKKKITHIVLGVIFTFISYIFVPFGFLIYEKESLSVNIQEEEVSDKGETNKKKVVYSLFLTGNFKDEKSAQAYLNILKSNGFEAVINLNPKTNQFEIIVGTYGDLRKAKVASDKIKRKIGIWPRLGEKPLE